MSERRWGELREHTLTEDDLYSELGGPVSAGEWRRAYCPIHGSDHQRSLSVSKESGYFRCHSCDAEGYMDWGREKYRARNGGKVGAEWRVSAPRKPYIPGTVEPVRYDLDRRLQRYQDALPGSVGERYLAMRGIPLDAAQAAGVGYAAPAAWPGRDWKGGRVIFAHRRTDGTLVNLYGRAVSKGGVSKGLKHDHLSGNKAWFVAGCPREFDTLYVAESALDALSLIVAGAPAAIAIFGVSGLRWDWLPLHIRKLVLALDHDKEGHIAFEKLALQAAMRGYSVSVMDSDDYGGRNDANDALVAGVLRVEPVVPAQTNDNRETVPPPVMAVPCLEEGSAALDPIEASKNATDAKVEDMMSSSCEQVRDSSNTGLAPHIHFAFESDDGESVPAPMDAVSDIHERLQQRVRSRLDARIENERHLKWDTQKTHMEPTPYLGVEKQLAWNFYHWCRFVRAAGSSSELEHLAEEMHDCILSVYDRQGIIEAVRTLAEELLPDSPHEEDLHWLSRLDRDATGAMETAGILHALDDETFATYVERARDHVLAGDCPGARLEYEALYREAREASKKSA